MLKQKIERTYRKPVMRATSIFLTESDCRQWLKASGRVGLSRSEFLRLALREKAAAILTTNPKIEEVSE
jgi:hypothetical protein